MMKMRTSLTGNNEDGNVEPIDCARVDVIVASPASGVSESRPVPRNAVLRTGQC